MQKISAQNPRERVNNSLQFKFFLFALILLGAFCFAHSASASTNNVWNSSGNTDYNTAANWSLGHIPTTGEVAYFDATSVVNCTLSDAITPDSMNITTGYTGTLNFNGKAVTGATAGDFTFNIGTGGTINLAASTITCDGNFDWSGATGTITRSTSTLIMTGTGKTLKAPYNGSPVRSFNGLTIQTQATVTIPNTVGINIVYGLLTINGSLIYNASNYILCSGGVTQGSNGIMSGTGTLYMTGGIITFANPSAIAPATIEIARTISLPSGTYSPTVSFLILSSTAGDSTFTWQAGTYTFTSLFQILQNGSATGTLTISGVNNPTLIFQSHVTVTQTTGTIAFSNNSTNPNQLTGTANQTINLAAKNMGTWVVNKPTSGVITWTSGDTITLGGNSTSAAAVTLPSGLVLFDANGYNFSVTSNFTASCTTLDWGEGLWTFGGNVNYSAVTTNTQSTAAQTYNGTGNQTYTPKTGATIGGAFIINKASGNLTQASNITTTAFTLTSGTLIPTAYDITTTGDFTIETSGQVTPATLAGSVWTVGGNFSATGEAGDLLTLNPASTWTLNVTGTANASYVSVAYSDASGGTEINASTGPRVDWGNNMNWNFGASSSYTITSAAELVGRSNGTGGYDRATNGDILYVPAGSYNLSAPLSPAPGVVIAGDGVTTILNGQLDIDLGGSAYPVSFARLKLVSTGLSHLGSFGVNNLYDGTYFFVDVEITDSDDGTLITFVSDDFACIGYLYRSKFHDATNDVISTAAIGSSEDTAASLLTLVDSEAYTAGTGATAQCLTAHYGFKVKDYAGYYHNAVGGQEIAQDNEGTPLELYGTTIDHDSTNTMAVLASSLDGCTITDRTGVSGKQVMLFGTMQNCTLTGIEALRHPTASGTVTIQYNSFDASGKGIAISTGQGAETSTIQYNTITGATGTNNAGVKVESTFSGAANIIGNVSHDSYFGFSIQPYLTPTVRFSGNMAYADTSTVLLTPFPFSFTGDSGTNHLYGTPSGYTSLTGDVTTNPTDEEKAVALAAAGPRLPLADYEAIGVSLIQNAATALLGDNAGFVVDTTAPVTAMTSAIQDPSNSANALVTLTCADTNGAGCNTTYYCNDTTNACTPTTVYTTPFNVPWNQVGYIRYYSTDLASNSESVNSRYINFAGNGGSGRNSSSSFVAVAPQDLRPAVSNITPPAPTPAPVVSPAPVLPQNAPIFIQPLFFGLNNNQVTLLQDKLKTLGFFSQSIKSNGRFGPTTLKAVQAFQIKNNIAKPGAPGYGNVGPKTRAVLNGK